MKMGIVPFTGLGVTVAPADVVLLAFVAELLVGPCSAQNLDGVYQPLHPFTCRVEPDAVGREVVCLRTCSKRQDDAVASRDEVERGGHLGEQRRVSERHVERRVRYADAARLDRDGRCERPPFEIVLGRTVAERDVLKTGGFSGLGHFYHSLVRQIPWVQPESNGVAAACHRFLLAIVPVGLSAILAGWGLPPRRSRAGSGPFSLEGRRLG